MPEDNFAACLSCGPGGCHDYISWDSLFFLYQLYARETPSLPAGYIWFEFNLV